MEEMTIGQFIWFDDMSAKTFPRQTQLFAYPMWYFLCQVCIVVYMREIAMLSVLLCEYGSGDSSETFYMIGWM